MTIEAEKLLEAALRLSDGERADIADRLFESLDPEPDGDVSDDEIRRRVAEIEAGTAEMMSWERARRIIRGASEPRSGVGR